MALDCAPPPGIQADLAREYVYWCKQLDEASDDTSFSVSTKDVLRAHFTLAEFFVQRGEGIGGIGPRSLHLLESAVARQHVSLGANRKWTTNCEVAATLFFGLIRDHPFHDANKRTALLTALYQLQRCGRTFRIGQKDLELLAVRTAERNLSLYRDWKRYDGRPDSDVRFLAHFLRDGTREVDNQYRAITFRELNTVLGRFKVRLANAAGNRIDVLQEAQEHTGIISFGKKTVERRMAQVVFHDWGAVVSPGAIREIRRALQLTPEYGVDSTVFYGGVDVMQSLVLEYAAPLERLANK